jgi:hypothetical protein
MDGESVAGRVALDPLRQIEVGEPWGYEERVLEAGGAPDSNTVLVVDRADRTDAEVVAELVQRAEERLLAGRTRLQKLVAEIEERRGVSDG